MCQLQFVRGRYNPKSSKQSSEENKKTRRGEIWRNQNKENLMIRKIKMCFSIERPLRYHNAYTRLTELICIFESSLEIALSIWDTIKPKVATPKGVGGGGGTLFFVHVIKRTFGSLCPRISSGERIPATPATVGRITWELPQSCRDT